MMSVYTNRQPRNGQFSILTGKNGKLLPNSYDNGSFITDSLPNITQLRYSNCFQDPNFHQKLVEPARNNNYSIPEVDPTSSERMKKTASAIQGAGNRKQLFVYNTDNTLVSENDVILTIDDKLPAITNKLYVNQKNHRLTLSTTTVHQKPSIKKALPIASDEKLSKKPSNTQQNNTRISINNCTRRYNMPPATSFVATNQIQEVSAASAMLDSSGYNGGKCDLISSCTEVGEICEEKDAGVESPNHYVQPQAKPKMFGRVKRSATINDESMMKMRNENDIVPLTRCKSIDSTATLRSCSDEQAHFFAEQSSPQPPKQRSKRKFLRRSMSVGFSKFKLITTNLTSKSHHRLNDEEFTFEINDAEHQTSRRKNTATPQDSTDILNELIKSKKIEEIIGGGYPLLRSLSAPDPIDNQDQDYDVDLSELHLPRRRAICPNLPVPAMKQLKTYLILTRLKQYCFV